MEEYDDEGLTCHTAPGVVFTTMDDLKEHYRSDWHRYNLKRKVAGLPVVGNELFERVMQQAAAGKNGSGKVTGTSHLKRPEQLPRSVQKAQRFETWAENHQDEIEEAQEYARRLAAGEISDGEDAQFEDEERDEVGALGDDGDDDDWESMASDEAEEVLARMEKMAMEDQDDMVRAEPRTTQDGHEMPPREAPELFCTNLHSTDSPLHHPSSATPTPQDYDSESDDDEGMQLDLSNAPVRLADNGYELIITRDDGTKKRIGPRELRRYYRQRHRPEDNRQSVLAIKAENAERGLVSMRVGGGGDKLARFDQNGRFYGVPAHIAALVKKAQKAARRYEGSRMIMGGSGNKKFDLNGQNVKTKLPKACPY
jgi:pre-60S factor REI1